MVWGMVIGRFLDVVCPGAGIVVDIYEAMQIVQDGIQAGEIAEAAGEHLLEQLSSEKRRGATKVSADRVHSVIRRCGICRQAGHNRRTCPSR